MVEVWVFLIDVGSGCWCFLEVVLSARWCMSGCMGIEEVVVVVSLSALVSQGSLDVAHFVDSEWKENSV